MRRSPTDNWLRVVSGGENCLAGMFSVNDQRISTVEAPFGGIEESGMGWEGGSTGLDDYLQTKLIALGL
jgi:succinate-semialdehyde dehydrogenase/glutarate-semialdehyde dehydrogenase